MVFLWLALFAIAGVLLRYFLGNAFAGFSFPFATLLVNALGSLAIGFLYSYQLKSGSLSSPVLVALSVGLLGALTTYSSFSLETIKLFQANAIGLAILNILLNNGLSISFCFMGVKLGH